jgi:repressor LexA
LSLQNLPPRQQEVYDLLLFYIRQHGYPPTMKELAELIGVRSVNAVAEHLKALERKG